MLNRSASLPMSTSVLKALPGKLDIKRHSSSILYLQRSFLSIANSVDPNEMPHYALYSIEMVKLASSCDKYTSTSDISMNSLPPWKIVHAFLLSENFFQNQLFQKNSFRNTIRVSNSLDPDQARHIVGPDLGPNCLQKFSADDTRR